MELQITAITNGSVIDHIDSEKTLKIMDILGLSKAKEKVTVAFNLESGTLGKKGIIKVEGRNISREEMEKISLLAPEATINYIENCKVVNKEKVSAPEEVIGLIKCSNSKCITNFEKVTTKFLREEENYRCNYCERTTNKKRIKLK